MGQTRERVVLIHELRELRGAEELLDRSHHGADVDQGLRGDRLDVLRGHALTHDALHPGQAGADLVLDELADGADAAVAEVIDVVELDADLCLFTVAGALGRVHSGVQRHEVADGGDDVLGGEHRVRQRGFDAELAVDLVAADLGQVVALRVEVQVVEQVAGGLSGRGLCRAQLLVDVEQRFVLRGDGVLGHRLADRFELAELLEDLRFGPAEGLEQNCHGLLALAVEANADLVALVDLELQPGTTGGDDLRGEDVLVRGLVDAGFEVGAGRTHELGDDDALGAVDDERALVGHEGEVTHEHGLALDLARVVVHELGGDVQRRRVGHIAFLALVDRVLGSFEPVLAERQRHGSAEVFDRRDLFEDVFESRGGCDGVVPDLDGLGDAVLPRLRSDQPVEAVRLQTEQIGNLEGLANLREGNSLGGISGPGVVVGGGQLVPSECFTI